MNAQKQTLYNVEWQALRVSLLGNWTTVAGTRQNIDKLREYLALVPMHDTDEYRSRLWRVLNCLNAVRMGNSGQGQKDSKHDLLVAEYRNKVSAEYKLYSDAEFVVDSEEQVREDWAKLDARTRKAILDNLGMRYKLHSDSKHRGELRWFLDIIGKAT